MTFIAKLPIDRLDKNHMRKNLEEILLLYKEIEQKIEAFQQNETVDEYKHFWQELRNLNKQNSQNLIKYMGIKCNR